MSDVKTEVIEFLSTVIRDFEFIVDNRQRLLIIPGHNILDVWTEVSKNIVSVMNQVETMTAEQLIAELNEVGFSVAQIEWEIERCGVIGIPFHKKTDSFREGTMVSNPPKDAFNKPLRPLLRWFNITLGSLSYAFPLLGPVKEFDKVIAQILD